MDPSRAMPALGTMPIVSTGFHAFKTYLYAAFRAEVIFKPFRPSHVWSAEALDRDRCVLDGGRCPEALRRRHPLALSTRQ
jgi:hypothetical protein